MDVSYDDNVCVLTQACTCIYNAWCAHGCVYDDNVCVSTQVCACMYITVCQSICGPLS